MIFKFPLDYIGITQFFSSSHRGIDLGWYSYEGEPVYAAADGIVYATNDYDGTGQSWGNYVKLSHGNDWFTLYGHLKNGLCVRNGQEVKQGDLLGYMGNTGYSFGTHLHYEVYRGGAYTSNRINPLEVTYVYPGQQVSDGSKNSVLYYNEPTPDPTPDYEKEIEELEAQIKELNDTIALKDKQIEELTSLITFKKYEYKVEEDNYYKIKMYAGETLDIKFPSDTEDFTMYLKKDSIVKVK